MDKRSFVQRSSLAAPMVIIDLLLFFIPLTAVLVMYVLLTHPAWFPRLVEKIYRDSL